MGTHRWRNFFYQRKSRNPSAAVFMGGGELPFERKQATTRKSKRMVKDPQNQIAISVSAFRGSVFFFFGCSGSVFFVEQNLSGVAEPQVEEEWGERQREIRLRLRERNRFYRVCFWRNSYRVRKGFYFFFLIIFFFFK